MLPEVGDAVLIPQRRRPLERVHHRPGAGFAAPLPLRPRGKADVAGPLPGRAHPDVLPLLRHQPARAPVLGQFHPRRRRQFACVVKVDPGVVVGPAPEEVETGRVIHRAQLGPVPQDALQRIFPHHPAHVLQEFRHGDRFAGDALHPVVAAKGLHGRPDGAHKEVGAADALLPELRKFLADALLDLAAHGGILAHRRIRRPLAADHVDAGGQCRRLLRPKAGLHLGVDGPGGGEVEPGLQQRADDRLPGLGGLVGKDDDGDTVRPEHAVNLTECLCKHMFKECSGFFFTALSDGIRYYFL